LPELPEVETVRRGLAPAMEGCVFRAVEQRRRDLRFPFPENFASRIMGTELVSMKRRAKYLCGYLSSGEVLIMHLGMSGRFSIMWPDDGAPHRAGRFTHQVSHHAKHDHVMFEMSNGTRIIYNDARRFGFMDIVRAQEIDLCKHFRSMGVEPLGCGLNAEYIAQRASGRSVDLKAFLLDQRIIAGLGNIYVCEVLHRAGLSPKRSAGCLARSGGGPSARAKKLVPAIQDVLSEAIAAGGSTLRDYAAADGALGYFQHAFRVYGREGKTCTARGCSGIIRRILQAGRSTFYCGGCQN